MRQLVAAACSVVTLVACSSASESSSGEPSPQPQPSAVTPVVVATAADGLAAPTDLAFGPDGKLWVVNRTTNGVVILTAPGEKTQSAEARVDRYAEHFMMKPTGLAFGEGDRFATCGESRDEWNEGPVAKPDDFMGPSLWSSSLDVFAKVGQVFPRPPGQKEGSHLDMLHQSPLCMGIAHQAGQANVFWAFDGLNGNLVMYDFAQDHGPGGSDHSDGIVRRHVDVKLTRVEGVSSHLAFEPGTAKLYIADTGTGRVLRVDTAGGTKAGALQSSLEKLEEYSRFTGTPVEVFAEGLEKPSGIDVKDGRVYVSENATGSIRVFGTDGKEQRRIDTGKAGLMGLAIGPSGALWAASPQTNEILRLDLATP